MSQDEQHKPDTSNGTDDFEITLSETGSAAASSAATPVIIKLDASVRQRMIEFAETNTSCELGGVLIGMVEDGNPATVIVEGMIPARYTDAVHASVTFTHETWQDIHAVKDRVFPTKKIIGWFHTHPGFGIFLSNYDLHIHRHFFNLNWQIAYVIDPLAHTEGFFRWELGDVRKTVDYEIIGATSPIISPITPILPPPVATINPWRDFRHYAIALLMIAVVAQALYHRTHPRTIYLLAPPHPSVTEQEIVVTPPINETAPDVTTSIPAPDSTDENQYHIVQQNDSLWIISRQYYGKDRILPGIKLIMIKNGLKSDMIRTGNRLLIPKMPDKPSVDE